MHVKLNFKPNNGDDGKSRCKLLVVGWSFSLFSRQDLPQLTNPIPRIRGSKVRAT